MEIKFLKDKIEFEKELNSLDKFTIDFTSILNKVNIKYVLVAGYVSILFGRNRSSEDIDLIIEKLNFEKFLKVWDEINKKFECLNSKNAKDVYNNYLLKNHAIRFSRKNKYIPNVELKFPKIELDDWTLENKKRVVINDNELFISPLELQIPFKLFLGSEKDIEDAKYLYDIFKDKLNIVMLEEFNRKLNIADLFDKYLR